MITIIKDGNEFANFLDKRFVLKLGKEGCPPCKFLDVILERINSDINDSVILKYEYDKNAPDFIEFIDKILLHHNHSKLRGFPTTLLFDGPKLIDVLVGLKGGEDGTNNKIRKFIIDGREN